ncbi:hypothetical protein EDD11_002136 [Mortierella claussenii]|nr:hypothetical protein EDD11_002136 [Mortierella claussenii]
MFSSIRGVLIDVSGTVHVGDKVIPGATEALDRLRASGIPFRFCTNTTQSSGDTLANNLRKLGFNVNREELNKAFRLLVESKSSSQPATLVAVHKAKYFADGTDQGRLSMGPGGFVEALEYASGIKAHVVGKPQKAFFELAIQNMGLLLPSSTSSTKESSGIVMIGDDVEQDLGGGAAELGLIRYLVQTGKYRAKDEDRDAFGGLNGIFADFPAVVDHILANQQSN